jgi:hypothetical protein
MGAMVRHCVGISLARCSSFSSSSRVHSVFLMAGSSHSYLAGGSGRGRGRWAGGGRGGRAPGGGRRRRGSSSGCSCCCGGGSGGPRRAGARVGKRARGDSFRASSSWLQGPRREAVADGQPGAAAHHLALHCLADLRTSSDEMRPHWLRPYFMTAALRISSCVGKSACSISTGDARHPADGAATRRLGGAAAVAQAGGAPRRPHQGRAARAGPLRVGGIERQPAHLGVLPDTALDHNPHLGRLVWSRRVSAEPPLGGSAASQALPIRDAVPEGPRRGLRPRQRTQRSQGRPGRRAAAGRRARRDPSAGSALLRLPAPDSRARRALAGWAACCSGSGARGGGGGRAVRPRPGQSRQSGRTLRPVSRAAAAACAACWRGGAGRPADQCRAAGGAQPPQPPPPAPAPRGPAARCRAVTPRPASSRA